MIATIMQARRISFLKVHLNAVFKECKRRPSLTLRIKVPRHTSKGNFHIHTYTIYFIKYLNISVLYMYNINSIVIVKRILYYPENLFHSYVVTYTVRFLTLFYIF